MLGGSILLILNFSIVFNSNPEFVEYYETCEAGTLSTVREDDVDDVVLWMRVSKVTCSERVYVVYS